MVNHYQRHACVFCKVSTDNIKKAKKNLTSLSPIPRGKPRGLNQYPTAYCNIFYLLNIFLDR